MNFVTYWPQLVFLTFVITRLCFSAAYHGKAKGPVNFSGQLFFELLTLSLLYFGGFFS